MTYPAFYMDGESAKRHVVTLSHSGGAGESLLVITSQVGEILRTWSLGDIYPTEKTIPSRPMVLANSAHPNERLRIEEPETKDWLNNILPGLSQRTNHRKETRIAIWSMVAIVLVGFAGYLLLPRVSELAAKAVPLEWEIEHFKNSSVNIARLMGAKQQCVGPQGLAVLNDIYDKVWLPDGYGPVRLRVVDGKLVNAYATPGREIIVFDGLIQKAQSPEEVVGVIAHELGHVRDRHPFQGAARQLGMRFLMMLISGGTITDVAGTLAESSYSRDNEREADRFALERLKAADIRTTGIAEFFERLGEKGKSIEGYLTWISTHPGADERATRFRAQKGGESALLDADWKALRGICQKKKKLPGNDSFDLDRLMSPKS